MKLLSMKAHNVFSIGTTELDLKDRGLTLVTGWSYDDKNGNMAGKSSIARNAPVWCMYGKTVDGVKADAVINTSIKNAKHCGVTLHFEGIDGEEYRIYRSRKPNSLVLSRKLTTDEGVEWDDLSKRLEKDTQELIDKLLGRDHKTFIQSDFFGQGRERSFLALTGSEQRAVIEEILPLSSLDAWYESAKEKCKTTQNKVEAGRAGLKAQRERVYMADGHLNSLTNQNKSWNDDHKQKVTSFRDELNKIQLMSSGIQEEIDSLMQALPDQPVEDSIEQYSAMSHQLTSNNATFAYKIDNLTGDIDSRLARPDFCNSCNQPLPADQVEENASKVLANKAEREDLIKKRGENDAMRYNNDAQLAICKEVKELRHRIKTKEREAIITDSLKQLQAVTNPFTRLVSSAKEELAKERRAADTCSKIIGAEEKALDHYKFWNHAFGNDLKTLLFEKVCPFLEAKSNQYLNDLNNGQIKVRFSTVKDMKSGDTKDQFSVTASSTTGSKTFELFSGAEKQLTSFAVGMALSDLAALQTEGASSFMILDEPFLYQSPENCENIVNFITQKLGHKSTILLISNEDNLVNLVPNRVHVVKRNGVSSIE